MPTKFSPQYWQQTTIESMQLKSLKIPNSKRPPSGDQMMQHRHSQRSSQQRKFARTHLRIDLLHPCSALHCRLMRSDARGSWDLNVRVEPRNRDLNLPVNPRNWVAIPPSQAALGGRTELSKAGSWVPVHKPIPIPPVSVWIHLK